MKVCYFGTYRANYSRNQIMIEGLRQNGVEVIECHETLWMGVNDRVNLASGGWLSLAFFIRIFRAYFNLIRKYRRVGDYDILIIGYPGNFDVFIARILAWIRRKPLVWDVFMSIYLIALERGLDKRNPILIRILKLIERLALLVPDLLVQDTEEYVDWFVNTYKIKKNKFRLVPTGYDDRIFQAEYTTHENITQYQVLYYGSFIPNHGVPYIMGAIKLLSDNPNIQFILIGDGPDLPAAKDFARENQLSNVQFIPWLEKLELVRYIKSADICLGAFGVTPQSMMTVQNKIFETLAMGRALISGESPIINRIFTDRTHIYLCTRENGPAISEAIQHLIINSEIRDKLAKTGQALVTQKYNLHILGENYLSHLIQLTGQS